MEPATSVAGFFIRGAVRWRHMPEHDVHHAVLTANLILDQTVSLHTGCQQLKTLLHRHGVDQESYSAITEVSSKSTF
jgi:hypothetical protein